MGTVKLKPIETRGRQVTAMQTSTKAGIGFGALAWLAGQVGEGRAFMAAAEQMKAQIEADVDALARTLRLPDSPPLLPLTGSKARSKAGLFVRCWLAGALLTWALVALPFILATAMAHDPKTPLAQGIVGGLGIGLAAAIFLGWLPGAIFFMITGSRENNRRSRGVVLDHFRAPTSTKWVPTCGRSGSPPSRTRCCGERQHEAAHRAGQRGCDRRTAGSVLARQHVHDHGRKRSQRLDLDADLRVITFAVNGRRIRFGLERPGDGLRPDEDRDRLCVRG